MNGFDLLLKSETEGLDSFEEAHELAVWLVETGLVNSTGSYQRFVRDVIEAEAEDELEGW